MSPFKTTTAPLFKVFAKLAPNASVSAALADKNIAIRAVYLNRYIFTGKLAVYTPKPPLGVCSTRFRNVLSVYPRDFAL